MTRFKDETARIQRQTTAIRELREEIEQDPRLPRLGYPTCADCGGDWQRCVAYGCPSDRPA